MNPITANSPPSNDTSSDYFSTLPRLAWKSPETAEKAIKGHFSGNGETYLPALLARASRHLPQRQETHIPPRPINTPRDLEKVPFCPFLRLNCRENQYYLAEAPDLRLNLAHGRWILTRLQAPHYWKLKQRTLIKKAF